MNAHPKQLTAQPGLATRLLEKHNALHAYGYAGLWYGCVKSTQK